MSFYHSIRLSSKGYMTGEISVDWIKNDFDPATQEIANGCPWLLIVDGLASHFTLSFLEYARDNNIHVLCLPPHTTHALQGDCAKKLAFRPPNRSQ